MDDLEKEKNIKILLQEVIGLKNKLFQINNEKNSFKKQFEKIDLTLKELYKENKELKQELKQELDKIKKK